MTHYGHEPPWSGSTRYGRWVRGPEMWDGSGYAWTWAEPRAGLSFIASMLRETYLPSISEQLNNDLMLMGIWGRQ